jgi:hypothetical protein
MICCFNNWSYIVHNHTNSKGSHRMFGPTPYTSMFGPCGGLLDIPDWLQVWQQTVRPDNEPPHTCSNCSVRLKLTNMFKVKVMIYVFKILYLHYLINKAGKKVYIRTDFLTLHFFPPYSQRNRGQMWTRDRTSTLQAWASGKIPQSDSYSFHVTVFPRAAYPTHL